MKKLSENKYGLKGFSCTQNDFPIDRFTNCMTFMGMSCKTSPSKEDRHISQPLLVHVDKFTTAMA